MKFRDVIAGLKEWFKRLNLAVWLHPKEFDGARRALLFGAAALVAASTLAEVPGYRTLADLQMGVIPTALSAELTAITRRAFLPRVYVQLWKSAPLVASLLNGEQV